MDRPSYDKRYRADYAGRVTYINVAFPKAAITGPQGPCRTARPGHWMRSISR